MGKTYVGVNNVARQVKRIYVGVSDKARLVKRAYVGVNGVARLIYEAPVLPDAYQQVQYIQSSGTQYINTNFTANQNTTFYIDFYSLDKISATDYGCIFGGRTTSKNKEYQLTTYSESGSGFSGTFRKNSYSYNAGLSVNKRINCKTTKSTYVNPAGTSTSINTSSYTAGASICIFALNNNATITQHGSVRLYSFKLYDNGTLVRNFYPCYRKSDSVIGLYDLVNKKFYTNNGSGSFTKGSNYEAEL